MPMAEDRSDEIQRLKSVEIALAFLLLRVEVAELEVEYL